MALSQAADDDEDWELQRLEKLLSSKFDLDGILPLIAKSGTISHDQDINKDHGNPDDDDNSDDETQEFDDDDILGTCKQKEIQTIIFEDASSSRTISTHSRREWKQFMSSDIATLSKTKKDATKQSQKEINQDQKDDAHDAELMDLLKASKLIEQYNVGELVGRDRQDYLKKKMHELGAKPKGVKHPLNIRLGMHKASVERAEKRMKEAKETSMFHKSIKNMYSADLKLIKGKNKRKHRPLRKIEKGLKPSIGKFKNGVLHLAKNDIRAASNR